MPIMDGCCCFAELRNGSRASSVFTLVTGILNIIIDIWMLVKLHAMDNFLEDNEKEIWLPPGILVFMYIELACNLGNIGLAMLLWVGINYGYEGKNMIFGWIWGMSSFRFYQFFIMVYTLIWIGGHRVTDVVFVVPEAILIAIYWVLNTLILLAALLCVVSYWQELMETLYGKEKRRRRFYKITNIRQANRYPGTMTPSMYSSRMTLTGMSRQTSYAQSNPALSSHPSVSGYGHPSTSSQHHSSQPLLHNPEKGYGHPSTSSQHQIASQAPERGYGHPSTSSQHQAASLPPQRGHPSTSSQHQAGSQPSGRGYGHPSKQPHHSTSSGSIPYKS